MQNWLGQSRLVQGHKKKAAMSSVLDYLDDFCFKSSSIPSRLTRAAVGIPLRLPWRSVGSYGSSFLM